MTANTDVHTYSYYCERPECVRRQRDELRDRMELATVQQSTPHPAITHCENCGCDWLDNGLNPIGCPYCKQPAAVAQPLTDEALLREALYALEYASDMTKPEDLQGCGCPICTNIAALRERLGVSNG